MKLSYLPILAAIGFAVVVARPCAADQTVVTPTPQNGTQTDPPLAGAPPSYVWDGHEYVGKVGTKYYYLGPRNTWVAMDPQRQYRYQEFETNNPDWQNQQIRNTRYLGHDQGQSQLQGTPNTTQPNQYPPAPANPGPNNPQQ